MNTVSNNSKKAVPIKEERPKPRPRVIPYVPGLKIKYLVPDPFGTGR